MRLIRLRVLLFTIGGLMLGLYGCLSTPTTATATASAGVGDVGVNAASLPGTYSGFFGFPAEFFEGCRLSETQMLRGVDSQYLSLKKMNGGIVPYVFCRIEYDPPAYGHTLPNGIALGDSAFPQGNSGNPRWEVMAHEQAHNFFGGTSPWYGTLAFPGPLLQESLAVLSAFYTFNDIISNHDSYGIDDDVAASLRTDFKNGRAYQQAQYNLYISRGAYFDQENVLTSQALDFVMIQYGEEFGWDHFERFAIAFRQGIASRFLFQRDGVSATERSTYVAAALSVAFGIDSRQDFIILNFPIDDALYEQCTREIRAFQYFP